MSDIADDKMILPDTGEIMVEGYFEMKLSFERESITVPIHGWWASKANDGIVGLETEELTDNVLTVLKARAAGMRVTMIAAADDEWGIGKAGDLPWRCPEDLRHFRKRTMGGRLVMGRTTFEGLPVKLDGRDIHVVSSSSENGLKSIDKALARLALEKPQEIIVAGGGRIYAAALPYCTHAEVTRMKGSHGCDTFAPDLAAAGWKIKRRETLTDNIEIEYWEKQDMTIEFKMMNPKLAEYGLPTYATPGSAAMDLRALLDAPVVIRPGETYKFDMGFGIDIGRPDIAAIVMPRSGLGSKGLVLANTKGLIDSDYQGPILCVAMNRNHPTIRSSSFFKKFLPFLHVEEKSITVNPGDRIFQMYFIPVVQEEFVSVEQFSRSTERGTGGYGSTGNA